jgi:hypothetical protein
MTNKRTSVTGHFDSHGGALVQYKAHCPMQHVQDYTPKPLDTTIGQLLAPYHPSGCQGISKRNNDEKIHLLCWPFLIAMAMRRCVTAHIA